jgi:ABC-type bacteriocin/lantibiotic exporter with double-glycine peptidase domain
MVLYLEPNFVTPEGNFLAEDTVLVTEDGAELLSSRAPAELPVIAMSAAAGRAGAVRLEGISKRFGAAVAVDNLSLHVEPGEFVCLLGPSGCGKTTTMRIIAGFVEPDAGRVFINDKDVSRRHPNRRDIGMVYQSYASSRT